MKNRSEVKNSCHLKGKEFNLENVFVDVIVVTINGKIVWKRGPNGPFYALIFRTHSSLLCIKI